MVQRFEDFMSLINTSYKGLQKIKSYEMSSLGLKGSHVMCMFYLGKSEGGLTSGELCEKCKEDKAAISRNLKYLTEKGYVKLEEDDEKKYKRKNVLTREGEEVYKNLELLIIGCVNQFGKGLTEKERNIFYKSLGVIVKNFNEFCENLENK